MNGYEVIHEKSPAFFDNYDRKGELQQQTHYCPGCGHGVVHKLIAEALTELGVQDRAVLVSPVGCSVFAYYYFNVGNVQVAHGRAPAAATALKRSNPESIVMAYQGDGDLAAIGTAEIIHAANRGENICVFFVNNSIYGMTGGQMAPTTLVGQKSTTSPWGRRSHNEGLPLHVCELLASLETPTYLERVALSDMKNIMKAKKAVKKALQIQKDGGGFSLVEFLSPCPTILKMDPVACRHWVGETLMKAFPLGVFRDHRPELPVDAKVPYRTIAEAIGASTEAEVAEPVVRHHHTRDLTLKFAGFGGQGILLMGQMLAQMGLAEKMEVSWLPSYGPEMRSGSAHCHVTLSHDRIGSPLISQPEVLVAMNELSLHKFSQERRLRGIDFVQPHGNSRRLQRAPGSRGVRASFGNRRSTGLGESRERGDVGRLAGGDRVPASGFRDFRTGENRKESQAAGAGPEGDGSRTGLRRQ